VGRGAAEGASQLGKGAGKISLVFSWGFCLNSSVLGMRQMDSRPKILSRSYERKGYQWYKPLYNNGIETSVYQWYKKHSLPMV